jgi:hypothetical protein
VDEVDACLSAYGLGLVEQAAYGLLEDGRSAV